MDSTSLIYPQRLKVVTGTVMAEIDRVSIFERGIPGHVLMQNAGESIAKDLLSLYAHSLQYPLILCGKGNNGGDGFVIASYLMNKGSLPAVILLCPISELKGDALYHYQTAKKSGVRILECTTTQSIIDAMQSVPSSMIIDALLGTGTKGAPRGLFHTAIAKINTFIDIIPIISVDIPSGVNADTGAVDGIAVQAELLYSIGLPKTGHTVLPGLHYYKKIKILDIGFPVDLLERAESQAEWLTPQQVNSWLPRRDVSAHKGTEGHLLVIAGSKKMSGAAMMCVKAAVLSGAGLVTLACPESIHIIASQDVWEKMTIPLAETEEGSIHHDAFTQIFQGDLPYSAIVIGPGLSRHDSTMQFVRQVVDSIDLPLLIDGDGLFAVSIAQLKKRKHPWVITPHPGEMGRLFSLPAKTVQSNRWKYAKEAVKDSNGVCVFKGPKTIISSKDNLLYINPTGNPAMASGGMGDVLAGMIGALLARGLSPVEAANCGAYLHGLAADLLVNETNSECINATKVSEYIQEAVVHVRKIAACTAA